MSAIQKELLKAVDMDAPSKGDDRQDFLLKLLKATNALSDDQWDALSAEAQTWINEAIDAKNAKAKTIPDFPDYKDEADEKPVSARRRSAEPEDDTPTGTKEVDPDDVKKGMALRVLTKRGKDISGTVVETDDDMLVIKQGNGEELEFAWKQVDKLFGLADEKPASTRKRGGDDEEEADPIKVGVEVKVVTKRGKEATGKITELDDEVIVIKGADGEQEFDRDRVESITPVKAAKADDKPASTRRRGGDDADDKGKGKGDDEGKKASRAANGGVSVSERIAELMLDDLDASMEDIGKTLKKEGIEFRENTLQLNYKANQKFLDLLRKRKMLKA